MSISEDARFDLHCHSMYSDGEFSPRQLIDLAKEKGLRGLSITDHDTVDAYSDQLFTYAEEQGIFLFPGIEISTQLDKQSIHVLGYGIDVRSLALIDFCDRQEKIRINRNQQILDQLNLQGLQIATEDLLKGVTGRMIGRMHIAKALLAKGEVTSTKEAFDEYLANGKSCYVMGDFPSVEEAINLIHRSGGRAILAHPYCLPGKILCQVLKLPFDGIEAYYSRVPLRKVKRWTSYAKNKQWLISGGSDFHSPSPYLDLGRSYLVYSEFKKLAPDAFILKNRL